MSRDGLGSKLQGHEENNAMKVSDFLNQRSSRYLAAVNFDDIGRILTMRKIEIELVPEGRRPAEQCPVLYFVEIPDGLVLRKTKLLRLQQLYGDEWDDWFGQEVHLHTGPIQRPGQYSKEVVDSILIDRPPPAAAPKFEADIEPNGLANSPQPKYFRRAHWAKKPTR
jgi:hypothetical protein